MIYYFVYVDSKKALVTELENDETAEKMLAANAEFGMWYTEDEFCNLPGEYEVC